MTKITKNTSMILNSCQSISRNDWFIIIVNIYQLVLIEHTFIILLLIYKYIAFSNFAVNDISKIVL